MPDEIDDIPFELPAPEVEEVGCMYLVTVEDLGDGKVKLWRNGPVTKFMRKIKKGK
jgi:hypothetical protein